LADLRADPDQEYFADGMTEALITDLAKIKALKVISRTSVMRYKNTEKSLPEIARELNVAAIVEGSILREGNRVRITAQLIEAKTDRHLWADSYDRELESILVLQSEVAQAIAREIQVAVTPDERERLASARTVRPEAYQAYLKGLFHRYKQTPEHFDTALEYFERALALEPDYALAYVGIAETWLSRADCGVTPPQKALPKAVLAANRAAELDDTLAEVHQSLAWIHFAERDWGAAEREVRRALELNPNNADAHLTYSDLLMSTGRSEEGMSEIERCLELDPLNFFFQCYYGWHLVYVGRNDDAIAQLQKTLKMEPNFAAVRQGLWGAFYLKREHELALDEAKAFHALLGDSEIVDTLDVGYRESGYPGAMLLAAKKLEARSQRTHVPATRIARMYAHAGDNDRALGWLEKACEAQENPLVHLRISWDWHNLRDDPRFRDLLRRVKLSE
jgi:TolB-like protein/cytochrome c-type biogenesis protein CcmH/NrfG